jgi:hypothetical protein
MMTMKQNIPTSSGQRAGLKGRRPVPSYTIDGRPAFFIGEVQKDTQAEPLTKLKDKRYGGVYGPREIQRPAAPSIAPIPRNVPTFERLEAIDLKNFGAKVRLAGPTISNLIDVDIGDPRDIEWLEERNRIVAKLKKDGLNDQQIRDFLEKNKPLGRDQRTIKKTVKDIGKAQASTLQKLLTLWTQMAEEGKAENIEDQASSLGSLASILEENKHDLTDEESDLVSSILSRADAPFMKAGWGIPSQTTIIDWEEFKRADGVYISYFANVARREEQEGRGSTDYDVQQPFRDFVFTDPEVGDGLPALTARQLQNRMGRDNEDPDKKKFLDLDAMGMISATQMFLKVRGLYGNNWRKALEDEYIKVDVEWMEEAWPFQVNKAKMIEGEIEARKTAEEKEMEEILQEVEMTQQQMEDWAREAFATEEKLKAQQAATEQASQPEKAEKEQVKAKKKKRRKRKGASPPPFEPGALL